MSQNPTLGELFAREYELPLPLVPYGILTTEALALRSRGDAPVNTFDRPTLEFEMARLQAHASIEGFSQRLEREISPGRLRAQLGRSMPWRIADFGRYQQIRNREAEALIERVRPDASAPGAAPR